MMKIVGYYTTNACVLGNPAESDSSVTQHITEDEKGHISFGHLTDLSKCEIHERENGYIQIILPPLNPSEITEIYHPSQNSEPPATEPLERVEKKEIDGKSSFGEIIYIRQLHDRPEHTKELRKIVGKYQLKIWQELERRHIKDIFVESLSETGKPYTPERYILANMNFPNGIPKNPTALQLELLANVGAATTYAFLNSDVTLHKTWSRKIAKFIDKKIKREGVFRNSDLIFNKREEFAANEIKKFLRRNRGKRVVLIFGDAHEFKDDFEMLKEPPVLISVSFPRILSKFNRASKIPEMPGLIDLNYSNIYEDALYIGLKSSE